MAITAATMATAAMAVTMMRRFIRRSFDVKNTEAIMRPKENTVAP